MLDRSLSFMTKVVKYLQNFVRRYGKIEAIFQQAFFDYLTEAAETTGFVPLATNISDTTQDWKAGLPSNIVDANGLTMSDNPHVSAEWFVSNGICCFACS
ncbi:hypothetical protein KIN20_017323 [Parelaphostrongylus tenuis]|uniref:Uncharacterized protein n=1 Tax=Parelaphostrongylus tenuis TaxID=148309 RepID=A0AAD5MHT3_PARTN|nr:hypothetical protein KIN20_017323 [Parelaphostrongylus tenuis]